MPVVAADAGVLSTTVLDGETGHHYPPGDVTNLQRTIDRTLRERDQLHDLRLRRREMISIEHSLDQLIGLYDELSTHW